jgi:putative phosphoesterase
MKVGIISDTHDHKHHTKSIIEQFKAQGISRIIHCGDFCSPFMMPLFKGFEMDAVFGNNDGDIFLLQKKADESGIRVHGGFWITEILEKKVAVYHGTYQGITQALLLCGLYDVVITGHTHEWIHQKWGKTVHLNPGSAHGFEQDATAMVYDFEKGIVEKMRNETPKVPRSAMRNEK